MAPRLLGSDLTRRGWRTGVQGLAAAAIVVAFAAVPHRDRAPGTADGFASEPDLRPPALTVDTAEDGAVSGSILMAPFKGEQQPGPMICDAHGELVWFHPVPEGRAAMNFQVQRFHGAPVLTWWEGELQKDGYGKGEYVIADDGYREIARFRSAGGRPGDFHEYAITPQDTALVTVYRPVHRDLSAIGGQRDDTVLDSLVQEIDIDTGRVLFSWDALDHVRVGESHEPLPTDPDEAYDFFHVNAVDVDHDGNLLISSRHTDTVFKVDRRTGAVIWRLGGIRSDFTLGPGVQFLSQHDARRQADGTITVFDNGNPPKLHPHSRAVRLRLDERTKSATLVHAFEHPRGLSSKSQGDVQVLPGGAMFVGWGSEPYATQFSADGEVEFDAHLPGETQNYRAFRAAWTGHPSTRPAIDVDGGADHRMAVHVSWNGATEVRTWQVLAGPRPDSLRPVRSPARRGGFETTIHARTAQPYVAVRAEDRLGRALGRSDAVPVGG